MAVITTREAYNSFKDQLVNGTTITGRKWFALQDNLLDGTYHPIPSDGSEEVGFISAYPTDAYGNILRPVIGFDGASVYVSIPNHADFNTAGPYTTRVIEVVIETGSDITTRQVIWEEGGATRGLSIYIDSGKIYVNGWNLADDDSGATTPWGPLYVSTAIATNTRYHVALVFDYNSGIIKGLLNGVSFGEVVGAGQLFVHLDAIAIGAVSGTTYFHDGVTSGPAYALCKIYEVRCWNVLKTDAELDFDKFKPIDPTSTGLIGYWPLDEGLGSVAYDKSPNAIDGTINSAAWTTVQVPAMVRWQLDTPRSMHKLRVVGDDQLNHYPVDFDVQLYDENGNLLHEENVVGNAAVTWEKDLGTVYDVTTMDISIHKAASPIRLSEISNPFEVLRSDSLKPTIVGESSSIASLVASADNLLSRIIEASTPVTANVTSQDTMLPKVADTSFFRQYEFASADTLLPKLQDASTPITVSFTKQDTLLPKVIEQKVITVTFTKPDVLALQPDVEAIDVTVDFGSTDNIQFKLVESPKLTNVHTQMDSAERTIYGKVEITYTDPFSDSSITVTASEVGRFTHTNQVADNVTNPKYKWLSLHDNKLDGTYHPLPADKEYSVGWWSTSLSDASGVFTTPPVLTVEFDPRPIYELKVVGDSLLGNYPVDFTIELLDSNDTVLYTETVTGNDQASWYKDIDDVLNVAKMKLTINKISKPYQPAKVVEFYTVVVETYYTDDLEGIHLLEELEYPSGTIALGAISANEIDITLDNTSKRFSLGNDQSPLNGLLKKNRKVRAWLGVEVVPGEIEWHQLGVFWTTLWKVPDQSVWAYATARDRLELLRLTDFTSSQVYENYTLYQLFELVLQDYGLTAEEYYIDTSLQDIVVPYAWFDRMSHREALQRLAGVAIVQVYCDRSGKIVIEQTQPTATKIYSFDDDKNLFDKDFPLVWGQIANYIEVATTRWTPSVTTTVCDSTEAFTVPANSEATKVYVFDSIPVLNAQAPVVTGGADIQVKNYTAYAWGMEITFENVGSVDEQVTQVTIDGQQLEQKGNTVIVAKDDTLIREEGKIKATIQHDLIQSTEYAETLASNLLVQFKNSRHDIVMNTRGNIALDLGDKVSAPSHLQDVVYEYMVKRQEVKWNGSLEATVEGKKI